jgi:hypothetical protein
VTLFVLAVIGATLLAPLGPSAVRAATDLPIGGTAVIADADGDPVRLRDLPGLSGTIIGRFPEGTTVKVLDGPVAAPEDGSLWYEVAVGGLTGYMAADFLAHPTSAASDPSASITGTAVIVNTGGDGIRCRAAPTTDSEILDRFVEAMPSICVANPRAVGNPSSAPARMATSVRSSSRSAAIPANSTAAAGRSLRRTRTP